MSASPQEKGLWDRKVTRRDAALLAGTIVAAAAVFPLGNELAHSSLFADPRPEGPEDVYMDPLEYRLRRKSAEGEIDTMFARWRRLAVPVSGQSSSGNDFADLALAQFPNADPQKVEFYYKHVRDYNTLHSGVGSESGLIAAFAKNFGGAYDKPDTKIGIAYVVDDRDALKFIVLPSQSRQDLQHLTPVIIDFSTFVDAAMRYDPAKSGVYEYRWVDDVRRRVREAQK